MTNRLKISSDVLAVILLLAVAAVIRDAYILQYCALPYYHIPALDAQYYDYWALRVATGHGYGPAPFYMAPLYPYFLAAIFKLFGHAIPVVYALQQALGIVNLWLAYSIGKRVFGHTQGLIAAILLVLYAPLVHMESKLLSETLGIALMLTSLLLILRAIDRKTSGSYLAAGIALGLSALCRPSFLIFAGILFIWLLLRRQPKQAVLLTLGLVLAVAPVTIRNCTVGKDCVLISTNGGIVFAQANHQGANGLEMPLPGFSTNIASQQQEEMKIASGALGRAVTPVESSVFWLEQGLLFIRENPGEWVVLLGKKLLWMLHNQETQIGYNVVYERTLVPVLRWLFLPFAVFSGLGFIGLLVAWKDKHRPEVQILALQIGAVVLGLLLFSVSSRYRLPMVPVLAVFAGNAIMRLAEYVKAGKWISTATALVVVALFFTVSLVTYPFQPILPGDPGNLGVAYATSGDLVSATRCFRQVLVMDPHSTLARLNLSETLIKQVKPGEAAAILREGLKDKPDDPRLHKKLGDALMMMGMKEEAAAEYRAAARLSDSQ